MSVHVFSYNEILQEFDHDLNQLCQTRPHQLKLARLDMLQHDTQTIIRKGFHESLEDYKRLINDPNFQITNPSLHQNTVVICHQKGNQTQIERIYPFGIETPIALITNLAIKYRHPEESPGLINHQLNTLIDDWQNGLIINHLMKYLNVQNATKHVQDIILKSLLTKSIQSDPFNQEITFSANLEDFNQLLQLQLKRPDQWVSLTHLPAPITNIQDLGRQKKFQLTTLLYPTHH